MTTTLVGGGGDNFSFFCDSIITAADVSLLVGSFGKMRGDLGNIGGGAFANGGAPDIRDTG